jgi:diguanylate cyclase (GGDEF)-like protein/PAS domain S-box-containing protein
VKKETILVVDDNRQLGDFIALTLLPSMGYDGQPVYDGASALISIRQNKPAMLLLDLELPDTNGLDLLRTLNKEGLTIPTILFTAHGSEQVAIDAFRLGVQNYLIKPVEPELLEAAISQALNETRLEHEKTRLLSELNEKVTWLIALSKIGQSVTSTLDLDDVLRRIVEAGVQLTDADEGFLALLDYSSGNLFLRATKNLEGEITSSMRLPVSDSLLGNVLKSGKPVREIAQQVDSPIKISTGLLVHSLLHVPIYSKGRPLGVLSVDNRNKARPFTPKDEVLLTSLADYASVALENASLYQQARHEIAERKRIETALRESEERFELAVRGANEGIWDLNLKLNKIHYSSRWKEMLGYLDGEIGDEPGEWFNRVHPDDIELLKAGLVNHLSGKTSHLEAEYRMRCKDGVYRWMICRGIAVRGLDGEVSRVAGSQADISERKEVDGKLLHVAFHDRLTDLPNRALFMDYLQKAIQRTRTEPDYSFAVLFLDLDKFKDVNDSLGHPTGDQLLIAVGRILQNALGKKDVVARLGGDEFVLFFDKIRDKEAAIEKSREILESLAAPIRLGQHKVFISTSIGIVLSTLGYSKPEDVLRDADIAMYAAKSQGKSTFQLFDPVMRERIVKRMAMEADLKQALEKQQLLICYQPILSLKNGELYGLEALVHWQHPEYGLLAASEFILLAQEIGFILPIDWWVFEEACRQINYWQSLYQLRPALKASVNLGSSLLLHLNLIESIEGSLATTGLPAENLVLEIAESIVSLNVEPLSQMIVQLRRIGASVQIDDFGSSYSSLLHLKDLPVNALKIDPAFVDRITDNGENTEIPRMIIELAHELGIEAFAEGIETVAQLSYLREMGCDYGQGFLFSESLAAEATGQLIEKASAQGSSSLPWQKYWAR